MADPLVKLSLTFGNAAGTTTTYSYNYANQDVTTAQVKALMAKMIEHGAIFKSVPTSSKSAKLVVTSETPIDLAS